MEGGHDEAAYVPLAQMTRQTREKFTQIIHTLSISDSATGGQGTKDVLQDIFERFQLWVGSVGASIDARSKLSLEWRLRDAPEIRERIVELQSDLVEALDDLYAITTGQRENRIRGAGTVDLDPGTDSEVDSVQLRFEMSAVNEAQDILEVVQECVKDLLRLSILIRKATPRDRWNRALQKPQDDRLDDRFDIQHVGEKFPKLSRPEHEWLKFRLGRAITQRRQFIRYCREHKNRMQEPDADDEIPTSSRAMQSDLMGPDVPGYAQTTTGLTLNPPVTEGSTHASTLQVTTLQAIRGDDDDDTASVATSVVSSVDLDDDESEEMLRLPSLQAASQGHDEFECPLCFTIQSFRQERKWKKHAYSDLKPYVCCDGKGECDLELFSSRNAWFTHELESHRYHWICFFCQREPLTSLARFQSHIQNKHVEIPVSQIPEVAQLCKKPLQFISAIDCPFCDDFEAKLRKRSDAIVGTEVIDVPAVVFRKHVAAHLEQLALFSLGPQTQPDEDIEKDSLGSRSDGLAADADVMKHFIKDQEEFEQDDAAPYSPDENEERFNKDRLEKERLEKERLEKEQLEKKPVDKKLSARERFDDERRRIIESCFAKVDEQGQVIETYITHIRIQEDAAYRASPPPPSSDPSSKKNRVIIISVRAYGRVLIHKGRENANGSFSIGKTWKMDDLSGIENFVYMKPKNEEEENHQKWAGETGFTVFIQKPYYWEASTAKEKKFFIESMVKIFHKYTKGDFPALMGFSDAELDSITEGRPELAVPGPRQSEKGLPDASNASMMPPPLFNSFSGAQQ